MKKLLVFMATFLVAACQESPLPPTVVEPGVSKALAQHRTATLSNIHYSLYFNVPQDSKADIDAHAIIEFELLDNSAPVQLDFRHNSGAIKRLVINGESEQYQFQQEHIVLPAYDLRRGRNSVEISFTAGPSSLNRNPDYLYTLFVPDRARTAFPLFDQPDLKATYDLALDIPHGWVAISNASVKSLTRTERAVEYKFARTESISSYLFSFVAGKFNIVTQERKGRSISVLHRETDADKVARNLGAVFDLHAAAIEWMEQYTGIDYPYQKLDFALIPAFQYGGMEHVGAIQYRASSLLLDETPSENERLNRASLVAHEVAHMWFGNLVTMAWFDDVWTKEVFANFMAAKIINPDFPAIDHDLSFLVDHYPSAYAVDRTAGSNPIRQALPNLRDAGQMYGAIIYHKAPIMMRQLELLLGREALRDGLREYLRDYAFANATWPDLIRILDSKTSTDLNDWSRVWVDTAGRPQFSIASTDTMDKSDAAISQLLQSDPLGKDRLWPQKFTVRDDSAGDNITLQIGSVSRITPLPTLAAHREGPLLFNADGMGYGLYPSDTRNLARWSRLTSVQKASSIINHYENLLAGNSGSAVAHYLSLLSIIPHETNQLILRLVLDQLSRIHTNLLPEGLREQALLEKILWDAMRTQSDAGASKMFFDAYAALAATPLAVKQVYQVWAGDLIVDKLKLAENDFINLSQILAIRLPNQADNIVSTQLARTQNPDSRRKLEFLAPTLSASIVIRDAFFDSLAQESNRQTESWVLRALDNLHHPSRIAHAEKYILPSLELLQEIQTTGDIFFPTGWLNRTLNNHHSAAAIATVHSFLQAHPEYSAQLRMKILQAVDIAIRANAVRRL